MLNDKCGEKLGKVISGVKTHGAPGLSPNYILRLRVESCGVKGHTSDGMDF